MNQLVLTLNGVLGKVFDTVKAFVIEAVHMCEVSGVTSDSFEINEGVIQGRMLAPSLFNIFMKRLLCKHYLGMVTEVYW